jgi:hypothetical protein
MRSSLPAGVQRRSCNFPFDVEDGFIVKNSYRRNPAHRVLSSIGQGFMQLEEELTGLLVSECNDLPQPEGDFIAGEFGYIQ